MKLLKFNESENYFNYKTIMDNIDGMLVDLKDEGITMVVEPSNDIKIKMLSLGRTELLHITFYIASFCFRHQQQSQLKGSLNLLFEKISMIVDYMNRKGFNTIIEIYPGIGNKRKFTPSPTEINLNILKNQLDTNFDKISTLKLKFENIINESLPRKQSVDQLKKVMKLSAKTDIGNRISDMSKQGANIDYIHNPINTGIESYEDYEKHNKKFVPSWNLKHVEPFNKVKKIKESINNLVKFDDSKYVIISYEDIIPDTNFGVYIDYNGNKYLVDKDNLDILNDEFYFEGIAVSINYYEKAKKVKEYYEEIKANCDNIRYSDDQYGDPSEWSAYEEYSKYYKSGNWSNLFWDYQP